MGEVRERSPQPQTTHTHHNHHPSAPVRPRPRTRTASRAHILSPESQISSVRYECERDTPTPVHPDRLDIPDHSENAPGYWSSATLAMRLPPALAMDSHATAMHRDSISSPSPPPSNSSCGLPPLSLDCL